MGGTPKFRGDPVALASDPRVKSLQGEAAAWKPQPPSTERDDRGRGRTRHTEREPASSDGSNDWVARTLHSIGAGHHANQSCALSADGRHLVGACSDSTMVTWDLWAEGMLSLSHTHTHTHTYISGDVWPNRAVC